MNTYDRDTFGNKFSEGLKDTFPYNAERGYYAIDLDDSENIDKIIECFVIAMKEAQNEQVRIAAALRLLEL